MSLLREIQASLMQESQGLGPILLKLRFLASRLGSDPLEAWIKHESEGYPKGVMVPDYRKLAVSHTATFSGYNGAGIKNAPIPPYYIEKYAGKDWTQCEMRQSIAGVDDLIKSGENGERSLRIDRSNLMLLLEGKIYEDYACNSVVGIISMSALTELQNTVRTRVMELTIQLEKSVPTAAEISVGPPPATPAAKDTEAVTRITQQIVHGNVTTIVSSGIGAQFLLNIGPKDNVALIKALVESGISESDATELSKIAASEEAESKTEPFGKKARVGSTGQRNDGFQFISRCQKAKCFSWTGI
jgi:AbiTii